MSKKKMLVTGLLAVAGLAASSVSLAQQSNQPWYLGLGLGQAKHKKVTCVPGGSCDDKDTAWKLFGGYQLNRNFAAEFGYTDLGKVTTSGGGLTAEAKTKAWELDGVGMFPIANRFAALARLGLYGADTKQTGTVSASKSNMGLTFGFGAGFDVTRNVGVRAEWQRYHDVGGGDIVKHDIDVRGVAATWRF